MHLEAQPLVQPRAHLRMLVGGDQMQIDTARRLAAVRTGWLKTTPCRFILALLVMWRMPSEAGARGRSVCVG